MYSNMTEILTPGEVGNAKLDKYHIEGFAAWVNHITPGEYVRLIVNGTLMMSNTDMEKWTSIKFVRKAEGNVLICGLGIGLVLLPLFKNPSVKTITVIEQSQDVIDLILPQIKEYDTESKLTVICADCFEWEATNRYDTIFIDIWPSINRDVYDEEMVPLKKKYCKFLSGDRRRTGRCIVWAWENARDERPLI